MQDDKRDEVYGVNYENASHQMQLLRNEMVLHKDKGFTSREECEQWAHDNVLDKVVFSHSTHKFFNVSHKGELLTPESFVDYYKSILYFYVENPVTGKTQKIFWVPEGFDYYDKACIPGEIGDGVHKPLYYRDYVVPTGYYNPIKDAFNVAKPFPVFAKETGRDTSHIYTLIEHVAGECAMWLLAWLRAKMINPTVKTQVVPIIVSRTQGSGKTTFAEVICKGLFGEDNVLVTDQYDSQARFNSDYADALIVCQEEKEETDRRNPAAAIKSRATATTIRKEQKGIDPVYQESYTDFLMTTNKDVPIKFDGREDQRRFMIMQADDTFTRKQSELADEVFTKLYGYDAEGNKMGTPFVEDKALIAQFKHELFSRADIAAVKLRQFPKTAAYNRCFTLPRTTEATEIESIIRALAPFIKASLEQLKLVTDLPDYGPITDVTPFSTAVQFMPAFGDKPKYVALCRPMIFTDAMTNKPYSHSVVERGIYDCAPWLLSDYGLAVIPDMEPVPGGFMNVVGRYKVAPAAKICLASEIHNTHGPIMSIGMQNQTAVKASLNRVGERLRVNSKFKYDKNGCFETVNEMKPGVVDLHNKSEHVQYMDTFLFESDECSKQQYLLEEERAKAWAEKYGDDKPINTMVLYKERLALQKSEAMRLFNEGTACRIVYSGAKSYHILVRVADAPTTIDEYKWLHAYLCTTLSDKIVFDMSTADPARLTRSPINLPRVTVTHNILAEGEQGLIEEDFAHVYALRWRELYEQWLNRPLSKYESRGKRLIPTKPEYKEAMQALLDGTFWTDSTWDGRRQNCFFAAYRLIRLLGYSHDELWTDDMIFKNLNYYKNPNEITYWKTRESSSIIKEIDANIDEIVEAQTDAANKS